MRIILFTSCIIGIMFFSSSIEGNYKWIVSNIFSLLFVLGGTLIATLISFPADKIRHIKSIIKKVYTTCQFDYADITNTAIRVARNYKKYGFKTLEQEAAELENPYLKLGLEMIADNRSLEYIINTLEKEFVFDCIENENAERILRSMAKYAPAFGLAGTIIGLMRVFPQLTNPVIIGSAMSLALLTTLYGVLISNLIFLPLANKLKDIASDDEISFRFVNETLECIHEQEYSVVIEQRLIGLMPRNAAKQYHSSKSRANLKLAENNWPVKNPG
ncbi:MAG: hypothetical protein GY868_20185 [Deltaproteobacteria bacterium]|nr:hypothetical protein [Deltaproteobacteria bacterium]